MTRLFCLSLVFALASSVQAQEKKDPPKNFTNTIGMKFVWIPPGSFMMGSPKEEKQRGDNETQHKVTLTKGFYMGVYTVTQEQWQEVMGNNPSSSRARRTCRWKWFHGMIARSSSRNCGKKTRKPYRLPTEAEWEFACRAGTTDAVSFWRNDFDGPGELQRRCHLWRWQERAFIERKPRQLAASQQMPGDFTTCTAMFGNGARTGMGIIHKKT